MDMFDPNSVFKWFKLEDCIFTVTNRTFKIAQFLEYFFMKNSARDTADHHWSQC